MGLESWPLEADSAYNPGCVCMASASAILFYIGSSKGMIKIKVKRAGEMAQPLRTLVTLPEFPSLIPSNHMVAHNYLK